MRPVSVGDLIGQAWAGYQRWWRYLVPLALVAYVSLGLFALLVILLMGPIGLICAALMFTVGYAWIEGVLIRAIDDIQNGEDELWIGTRLARLRPRMNALSVGTLLSIAGVVVGFMFFFVPGILLLVWWALLVPIVVLEGEGAVGALKRSRSLVRGHWWTVFFTLLVTGLLTGLASAIVGALGGILSAPSLLTHVIGTGLVAPFAALTTAVLYYELRGPRGSSIPERFSL